METKMQEKPNISIIVAISRKDSAIGNGGKLLFRISDDLRRFKELTKGHPVIMGRKTFESIGKPLPDRVNIVVTRNPNFKPEGAIIVSSLEEAIEKAFSFLSPLVKGVPYSDTAGVVKPLSFDKTQDNYKDSEIFVVGGGEIYRQALPYADKLYLTVVESDAEGDVFFPDWRNDFTRETFREERFDEKTGLKYAWINFERDTKPTRN